MNFAPGAWRYAIVPLLVAPFALLFSVGASVAALAVGLGTLAFFRDPDRTPPPTGVVAPADGKVSVIRPEGDRLRVGIFMNVHNVHVVRAPFDAAVERLDHEPGTYKPAFSKDSDRNEKLHVRLRDVDLEAARSGEGPDQTSSSSADVTFIAGAFARRIHPYVDAGDDLERGQRLGHIAFGSRVDVRFPPGIDREDLAVSRGETVTAGETVLLETDDDPLADLGFDADADGLDDEESTDGSAVDTP
ncbi:protein sorting system archaetidylserine decarboxylase [Natrononativus amylolyticus]|uniref:protein sorting system archaetidylserine decarboxylase n=1 Tax=Natrononativus amylolyticus TaxID=2963434 RepID=UPI0020CD8DF5|nr:protein sorting system archaetidylserine decarboxylase [Natrononativus amylolyticus]